MQRPTFGAIGPSWFAPYLFNKIWPAYMFLNVRVQNMERLHWGQDVDCEQYSATMLRMGKLDYAHLICQRRNQGWLAIWNK